MARVIPAPAGKSIVSVWWCRTTAGHPRACGEEVTDHPTPGASTGSSPRLRGRGCPGAWPPAIPRVIPAPAGKSVSVWWWCRTTAGHPRACGEERSRADSLAYSDGSSPRLRGREVLIPHERVLFGVIPAPAGKRRPAAWRPRRPRGHPRACGEEPRGASWSRPCRGSSPRLRGRAQRHLRERRLEGVIPAPAGKSSARSTWDSRTTGHPRACGEEPRATYRELLGTGSSPRLRGRALCRDLQLAGVRVIPAPAGKSAGIGVSCGISQGHPRACGEEDPYDDSVCRREGSSPRLRGRGSGLRAAEAHAGVIPAPAGKSTIVAGGLVAAAGHPRACGEEPSGGSSSASAAGSSPRLRGRARRTSDGANGEGVIPAPAGKRLKISPKTPLFVSKNGKKAPVRNRYRRFAHHVFVRPGEPSAGHIRTLAPARVLPAACA